MLPKNISFMSLLGAVVLAGVVGSAGHESYLAMSTKAQAQTQAVADFQDWKRQYTNLLPIEERWNKSLQSFDKAKDLYTLHTMLGDTPTSDPDTLIVDRIERVTQNDHDLGAARVCLSTVGSSGVVFTEKDFATLLAGLNTLGQRPDVQMGALVLSHEKATAKAVVSPLCLLLRDPEVKKK